MPAKDPSVVVTELQQQYLKTNPPITRPKDIAKLLQLLRGVTDEVESKALSTAVPGTFYPMVSNWRTMLSYYEEQVAAAPPDDRLAIARTVTDPLLRGYCWGPPSCSGDHDPPLAVTPRAAEPFILLRMLEVAEEADMQNTFLAAASDAAAESWEEIKKAGGVIVSAVETALDPWKPLLHTAGVVFGLAGAYFVFGRR